MKIPGLEDALGRLDVLNEKMIPLLERIAENTDRLVEYAESQQEWNDRNDRSYS